MSDLRRCNYFGVCKGNVSVSDCVAAILLVLAEDVSVRMLCGAAVILAFAEEVSL